MNRRGFLRGLGLLAVAATVPIDKILPVTDFIERKTETKKPSLFTNHMTVERRTVKITGDGHSQVIWMKYGDGGAEGYDICQKHTQMAMEQERKMWFKDGLG